LEVSRNEHKNDLSISQRHLISQIANGSSDAPYDPEGVVLEGFAKRWRCFEK
jgi:hypothetical protein